MSFCWLGARPERQRRPENQAVYGLRIKRPQLDDEVPRHQQRAHREHHVARQTHPLPEHFDADLYSSTLFLLSSLWLHLPEYFFIFDEFIGHGLGRPGRANCRM
jgi:hypothetical protein